MKSEKLRKIRRIYRRTLSFIYPHYCYRCEGKADLDSSFCPLCQRIISDTSPYKVEQSSFPLSSITTLLPFNKETQQIIHHLKYDTIIKPAQELISLGITKEQTPNIDIITPIPLHWYRKLKRGYNQAEKLSQTISSIIEKPIIKSVLRKRYTTTQTRKNREERRKNMENVFMANPNTDIENKKILLVDDVYTTGATAKSCAEVLLHSGASEIHLLTIAKA